MKEVAAPALGGEAPENRSVTLSGQEVRAAIRLLRRLVDGEPLAISLEEQLDRPIQSKDEWPLLVERARQALMHRRRRAKFFNPGMFSEPGWEILLALYIEQQGIKLTISRLTEYVGLPYTTVGRWLDYLEDQDLVERHGHPLAGRSILLKLSDKGRRALDAYFSERPADL